VKDGCSDRHHTEVVLSIWVSTAPLQSLFCEGRHYPGIPDHPDRLTLVWWPHQSDLFQQTRSIRHPAALKVAGTLLTVMPGEGSAFMSAFHDEQPQHRRPYVSAYGRAHHDAYVPVRRLPRALSWARGEDSVIFRAQ